MGRITTNPRKKILEIRLADFLKMVFKLCTSSQTTVEAPDLSVPPRKQFEPYLLPKVPQRTFAGRIAIARKVDYRSSHPSTSKLQLAA